MSLHLGTTAPSNVRGLLYCGGPGKRGGNLYGSLLRGAGDPVSNPSGVNGKPARTPVKVGISF